MNASKLLDVIFLFNRHETVSVFSLLAIKLMTRKVLSSRSSQAIQNFSCWIEARHLFQKGIARIANFTDEADARRKVQERIEERAGDAAFKQELTTLKAEITASLKEAFQVSKSDRKNANLMPNSMTDEEVNAQAALLVSHVHNAALDSGLSPTQIWNTWGAKTFLGAKDVTRDVNGNVIALSGKGRMQGKKSLFQVAGLTEQEKIEIDGVSIEVVSVVRDKAGAEHLLAVKKGGEELVALSDGFKANLSKESANKMLHSSSIGKSVSPYVHFNAVANAKELFRRSVPVWDHPDNKGKHGIKEMHRRLSLMVLNGKIYPVKITIKEYFDSNTENKYYTVEAVEVEDSTSLLRWVDAEAKADNATSHHHTRIATVARVFEKLNKSLKNSLKQDSLGEYFPDSRTIIRWAKANPSTAVA